jgi:pilus assembly protein Flp/PilA
MYAFAPLGSFSTQYPLKSCNTHEPEGFTMLKAYSRAAARINSLRNDEDGATATEYALIIGVASIAIVAALALIAPAISTFVTTDIVNKL